jgi:hypothetical protein
MLKLLIRKTNQKKHGVYKVSLLFLLLLLGIKTFSLNDNLTPPPNNVPLEVTVNLHINKIYNINTVHETYQIDGYLEYSWIDERMISTDTLNNIQLYENDKARELLDTKLWIPAFELINIQASKQTPNFALEIYPNGKIVYEERFFGTFSSYMNFRNFPFDSQSFKVQIEAFSYDNRQLVFTNPELFLEKNNDSFSEKWKINNETAKIKLHPYPPNNNHDSIYFSRATFEINAKRMTGYYLWQVLFPLFIIIMASFVIFWIKDFGTQMGVGFTLMLTVVAFNFYSASILPKLSYQTFIEAVIIVGYIFIFLGIIAVIINHRIYGNQVKLNDNKLILVFRYLFPLTFFTALFILFYIFKIK